jgi:two-component system, chemotaxis family, sensor kinase CheA
MNNLHQEFLKQTISNLETLQSELPNISDDSEDFLHRYFRCLHTIKGTSNTFNLFDLAKLSHKIEDLIQAIQNNQISPTDETSSVLHESFPRLLQTARNYQNGHENSDASDFINKLQKLIPHKKDSEDLFIFRIPPRIVAKLSINERDALNLAIQKGKTFYLLKAGFTLPKFSEDFKNFKELLNRNGEVIAVSSDTNRNPQQEINFRVFFTTDLAKNELENLVRNFNVEIDFENVSPAKNLPENLAGILENLVSYGKKTAQFLNKNIAFETDFCDSKISPKQLILLNEVASHLLHNAIDHAIETVEQRSLNGKNPTARIKISCEALKNELVLKIEDDGSGIDVEKILSVAKAKGLNTFDENEVLELIFSQGFSTSESISQISGRGVGLDAVKDLVEKTGGRIEVETKGGFGTTFSVYLPHKLL